MANGNNKTTEWFIAKCKEKFPDYNYEKTVYVDAKTKVIRTCNIHGDFIRTPDNGAECQVCSRIRRTKAQTGSLAAFIAKATQVHGDKYDYSRAYFKNARTKLDIRCKVHDTWFSQAPDTHCSGKGCKLCANDLQASSRSSTLEHFLIKARKVHGDRYKFDNVKYKNAKTDVLVTCDEHGDFTIRPDNLWSGSGCMVCNKAGFKSDKPAYLYVLRNGNITKIGITGNRPEKRCNQISSSFGSNFEILKVFTFDIGNKAIRVEQVLLNILRCAYKSPEIYFDGYTECFIDVDMTYLIELIENELSKFVNE
jgi:hypothetical protein